MCVSCCLCLCVLIEALNQAVIPVWRVGPLLPCLPSAKQTGLYSQWESGMFRYNKQRAQLLSELFIYSEQCKRCTLFASLCFNSQALIFWGHVTAFRAVDEIINLILNDNKQGFNWKAITDISYWVRLHFWVSDQKPFISSGSEHIGKNFPIIFSHESPAVAHRRP